MTQLNDFASPTDFESPIAKGRTEADILMAMLPADGHVHTEWSWDCEPGDMEASCARAVAVGLPAIAFTEHLDFTVWTSVEPAPDAPAKVTDLITEDGTLAPPALDVDGYLACVQRCRERFPDLVILTGVEVGEPHWHRDQVATVLAAGQFDRVLGSLHTLPLGEGSMSRANTSRDDRLRKWSTTISRK